MSQHKDLTETPVVERGQLRVDAGFSQFIEHEALPGAGLKAEAFWEGLSALLGAFAPRNAALLQQRDTLQSQIDAWLTARRTEGRLASGEEHARFLREIGYLAPEGEEFTIGSTNVDAEIATLAGPQLVVPLSNARYTLNAANARWGSLYDALYGTDAIALTGALRPGHGYNAARGAAVIARGRAFLDRIAPLAEGSHANAAGYLVDDGVLVVTFADRAPARLRDPEAFRGYLGRLDAPDAILLRHHGLHTEIVIDRTHSIGRTDPAGVADLVIEAALTTIMDLEDSVSAVNAQEKTDLYRTMLHLVLGDLSATFEKAGRLERRTLAPDRIYMGADGQPLRLPGRSLMLFRNVGHLTTTDAVILANGARAPEGIIDGAVTALLCLHGLSGHARHPNSAAGSVYIVKPKMHGPQEAAFANDLFDALEDLVGLKRHTLKIGVMDEERRTSANLKACIRAVKDRVIFINTGFLDRTGDEIHTSMHAGAFVPKGAMRSECWFAAYEARNVQIGLSSGFAGKGQIGKGMWVMPDRMAEMLATKGAHPRAGANAAWVPSPTAAVLHALHYHDVDVPARQNELTHEAIPRLTDLLTPAVKITPDWPAALVSSEIDNNCQGILGYVVRWIDHGIGCSKVPDVNGVGLMEDRATLRISSQLLANWLMHGVCEARQIDEALARMAVVVDAQNAADPHYRPMTDNLDASLAFQCARDLIFHGAAQPNGYTEPLLSAYRERYLRRLDRAETSRERRAQ